MITLTYQTSPNTDPESKKNLIFVVEYLRHGHRAPVKLLEPITYDDTPLGELTNYGKE